MAVPFNTTTNLFYYLAQVLRSRAETLLNHPNSYDTIKRTELAGILVALQQGHTDIASDRASRLSQISKQALKSMCMRTYLHAELIQAISDLLEHSPHPVHFCKAKAHSAIIVNEGTDACACTAALTDTTDMHLQMPGIPSTKSTGFL
eukprot:1158746-Pelagomonas_calceolata.AAC.5